jgi:hypothetical protein
MYRPKFHMLDPLNLYTAAHLDGVLGLHSFFIFTRYNLFVCGISILLTLFQLRHILQQTKLASRCLLPSHLVRLVHNTLQVKISL